MNMSRNESVKRVGIIGGGKAGHQLFQLFSQSALAQVAYVSDINPQAPAMQAAQKSGTPTYTNIEAAADIPADFIFEVTGIPKVVEMLKEKTESNSARLITHDMAHIILAVIDENNAKVKSENFYEIQQIKAETGKHLERLGQFTEDIEDITSDMSMLSINARIEAARVGEAGKGFTVVAAEMGKSSAAIQSITEEIEQIKQAIQKTSDRMEETLRRLM